MPFSPNLDRQDKFSPTHTVPEHLNNSGCLIRYSEGKGRGVYASRIITAQTVVEISPVLFFSKEEYEAHGKYTVLDHYTFKWPDGRMALALGLGSLFNHSETPNVSFTIDSHTESIRYTTTRLIEAGEELCIFYGHKLWFRPVDQVDTDRMVGEDRDDGWGGLSAVEDQADVEERNSPFSCGDPDEIISEKDLPFTRIKITPDEVEEEELIAVRTIPAWVVDIRDPRSITTMLKWLKQSGLDSDLGHLKRIRRKDDISTLLLCTSHTPPDLPKDVELSEPYVLAVPLSAALTLTSAKLKSSLWPTIFAPRRKGEEEWSRGKARWAWEAMQVLIRKAAEACAEGELPVIAHVPSPYEEENQFLHSFTASDTRRSTSHPLRHAVLNVVRRIAEYRGSASSDATSLKPLSSGIDGNTRNGTNYLLTSLTLFITHEPCIMCSMALLHSRVKEVFYLIPMEKTGGCGSLACLPKLEGVNHRFSIGRWKTETEAIYLTGLEIDETMDA